MIGVKHEGRKKARNPNFPYMSFAIHMCSYCDEPLSSPSISTDEAQPATRDEPGYTGRSYHEKCFFLGYKKRGEDLV